MHLKNYIFECISRMKLRLLQFRVIAIINGIVKAHKLRFAYNQLSIYYTAQAKRGGIEYQEKKTIEEFRQHLLATYDRFVAKKTGELRVFWVGANQDQDESGFLQALRRVATVIEFQNWQGTYGQYWKGAYGQWCGDTYSRSQRYDAKIVALNDQYIKSQLQAALQDGPVDLLIGQMWANYLSKDILAWVRSCGIPVINISMDDRLPCHWETYRGVQLGAVGLSMSTDMVLTTSSEMCLWYAVEHCHALFWPLASDPELFAPEPDSIRDIDVLFIGNKYGIRENIIHKLHKQGIQVECYGAGWPNGPSTAVQSVALFKRARIVLGVGTVGHCDDFFTMKLRDFDAPMSGALYLTHRNLDLTKLYSEGVEIECYATPAEAARKIQYYLTNPIELSKIAAAGHRKALERDTWTHRLHNTFSLLGLLNPSETTISSVF